MITGDLGSGKTCMLTRYGVKSSIHKKLMSNYHFNMDCRTSMSKRNRLESYFILQTRKKNVDLYFTSQYSELVETRLIRFVSIWIKMQNIMLKSRNTGLLYKHPYKFIATIHDYRNKDSINVSSYVFDGRPWFNEYDTNEVIYPPDDIFQTQKALAKRNTNKKK